MAPDAEVMSRETPDACATRNAGRSQVVPRAQRRTHTRTADGGVLEVATPLDTPLVGDMEDNFSKLYL